MSVATRSSGFLEGFRREVSTISLLASDGFLAWLSSIPWEVAVFTAQFA